jgi:1-phosphatidylinositol-3-phosphate 5-kinase
VGKYVGSSNYHAHTYKITANPELRQDSLALVGGNFSFIPRPSPEEHEALVKVLRTAVFIMLSMLLEQCFLADANVELRFPKPDPRVLPANPMLSGRPVVAPRSPSPDGKHRFRDSFLSTSIWGVFGKRTVGFLHRNPSFLPTKPASDRFRGGSIDIPSSPTSEPPPNSPITPAEEPPARPRRFSFFGEHLKTHSTLNNPPPDEPLFQTILRRLQDPREILNTSPDVSLPPPVLLSRLAASEKDNPKRHLLGEERTALNSVFGWEGPEARGSGMTGIKGFIRQQRISVLYSERISMPLDHPSLATSDTLTKATSDPEIAPQTRCGPRACLRTFDFYGEKDCLLGDFVVQMCQSYGDECTVPKCPALRGQHELRWSHKGIRIIADIQSFGGDEVTDDNVHVWETCVTCDATSGRRQISDGA